MAVKTPGSLVLRPLQAPSSLMIFLTAWCLGCDQRSPPQEPQGYFEAGSSPASEQDLLKMSAGFRLEKLAEYGISGADHSQPDTAPQGGAILGKAADVTDAPNGDVFILDSEFKKVAVFRADGGFERVILGGFGEGPGEFRVPVALDSDLAGRIYVLDYALGRVSVFGPNDSIDHTVGLSRPHKDLMIHESNIFATSLPAREYLVYEYASLGEEGHAAVRVTPADLSFSPDGITGFFGRSFDGAPLVASTRPGIWHSYEGGRWVTRGTSLLGEAAPKVIQGTRYSAGQIYGIAAVEDVGVVIAIGVWNLAESQTNPELKGYLGVFGEDGRFRGTITLPYGWMSTFSGSRDHQSILVGENDPFPRVVRYRFVPLAPGSR